MKNLYNHRTYSVVVENQCLLCTVGTKLQAIQYVAQLNNKYNNVEIITANDRAELVALVKQYR